MCTIQRTPGGFPRGRPALSCTPRPHALTLDACRARSGWLLVPRYGCAVGDPVICSAKGCQAPAVWALLWNNPRIHEPDRRKTWVACDDHRTRLSAFLEARGFLREVTSLR